MKLTLFITLLYSCHLLADRADCIAISLIEQTTVAHDPKLQTLVKDLGGAQRDQADHIVLSYAKETNLDTLTHFFAFSLCTAQATSCQATAEYTDLNTCLTDFTKKPHKPFSFFVDQLRHLLQKDPKLQELTKDLTQALALKDTPRVTLRIITYLHESQIPAALVPSFFALALCAANHQIQQDPVGTEVPTAPQSSKKIEQAPPAQSSTPDYADPIVFMSDFLDITKKPHEPLTYWVKQMWHLFKNDPKLKPFIQDIAKLVPQKDANRIALLFLQYQGAFSPALRNFIKSRDLNFVKKALIKRVQQ